MSILQELRLSEPQREVEVTIQENVKAYADLRLMRIALTNLVSNSWKFTSKTKRARIEFGAKTQDGERVLFVKDNGAGFNMEYVNRLFLPFHRLHTEKEFSGTGIGLATVARVINRHNGKIWTEAKEDQGATFFFTLGTDNYTSYDAR